MAELDSFVKYLKRRGAVALDAHLGGFKNL